MITPGRCRTPIREEEAEVPVRAGQEIPQRDTSRFLTVDSAVTYLVEHVAVG
ncbi:MAG: hypothetical protein WEB67_10980 [Acidimicrobiia bacterium]